MRLKRLEIEKSPDFMYGVILFNLKYKKHHSHLITFIINC